MRLSTSFTMLIVLAIQLAANAVPIQNPGAIGIVPLEYAPGEKRALFSKPKTTVVPAKTVTPAKSTALAKSASTTKSTAPAKSASAAKATSASIAASAPLSAPSGNVTSGDVCVLGGKDGAQRRGCIPSKPTEPPEDLPPLQADQIRLTDQNSGRLLVGTVGAQIGTGSSSTVFNVDWPGAKGAQVAKRINPGREAGVPTEISNLDAVKRLTASGLSTLGPTGEQRNWIVSPLVGGQRLAKSQEFRDITAGPQSACKAFLAKRCQLLSEAVVALEKTSKLVLDDLNDVNIHWAAFDDNTHPDFFDFGNMLTKANKGKRFKDLGVKDTDGFARANCQRNWPVSDCKGPDDSKAGSSSTPGAGPSQPKPVAKVTA